MEIWVLIKNVCFLLAKNLNLKPSHNQKKQLFQKQKFEKIIKEFNFEVYIRKIQEQFKIVESFENPPQFVNFANTYAALCHFRKHYERYFEKISKKGAIKKSLKQIEEIKKTTSEDGYANNQIYKIEIETYLLAMAKNVINDRHLIEIIRLSVRIKFL